MKDSIIDRILSKGVTGKYYRGTFPEDINFTFNPPYCVVTNCDSHNGKGTHWNAWFIDSTTIFFFDSYGRDVGDDTLPEAYKRFVKNKNYVYNPRFVEGVFSKTCGEFCIFVLHFLCKGVSWSDIIDSFSKDTDINDENMRIFVKKFKN